MKLCVECKEPLTQDDIERERVGGLVVATVVVVVLVLLAVGFVASCLLKALA